MRSGPPEYPGETSPALTPNPIDPSARGDSSGKADTATPETGRVRKRYRDNLARHLIGIARDLQNRVMSHLTVERGYSDLRPSLGPLLSLVRIEPRPSSALATALSITPQACSQMVNYAERAGYVERVASEGDRRAKLIRLTERGNGLVEDAGEIILSIDAEYRSQVGQRAYARLTTALGELFQGLGIPAHADPELTLSSRGSAAVLPMISVQIQQGLMTATMARGHSGLKMSHGQILPMIGPEGARVHQIARIHRVSRQAVSTTARDLESLGYLHGETDPRDGRGVVLRLTDRGETLIRDSVGAVDELEQVFLGILGRQKLAHLQTIAHKLYLSLHLEEEIFEDGNGRVRPPVKKSAILLPTALRDRLRRDAVREPKAGATRSPRLEQLAAELRSHLGPKDAARLASLLMFNVASDHSAHNNSPRSPEASNNPSDSEQSRSHSVKMPGKTRGVQSKRTGENPDDI